MIEEIEKLRAKLELDSFCKRGRLLHRKIEVEFIRPLQRAPSQVAVKSHRLQSKGARSKIEIWIPQLVSHEICRQPRAAGCCALMHVVGKARRQIGTIVAGACGNVPGTVETGLGSVGQARRTLQNGANLPPFQQSLSKSLMITQGKVPGNVGDKAVAHVEGATAPLIPPVIK